MKARQQPRVELPQYRLTLRVRHPSLDPAELTRAFGCEPLHSFKAGDPRSASGQASGSACHASSYWLAELDPGLPRSAFSPDIYTAVTAAASAASRQRLESMLTSSVAMGLGIIALRVLQPQAALLGRIASGDGDVTLLVEIARDATEDLTLTPALLRVLADLGVTVSFEFGEP